jgi:hypothetical protein
MQQCEDDLTLHSSANARKKEGKEEEILNDDRGRLKDS